MKFPSLIRFLYNHNPFYFLSTCFVLYAFLIAFHSGALGDQASWMLARLIGGFTLLMAATGYLVIRLGKVWDDARSILCVVLLLFFAQSVSFDETCVANPSVGLQVLTAGFAFAIALTEGLLGALSIKLPNLYRVPYYATLGLLFFYPLHMAEAARDLSQVDVSWRIYGFACLSALVTLLLLPAVRRGAAYIANNGTPWPWPYYPWSAFVLLGVGMAIRIFSLHFSFIPMEEMKNSFGLFFLTPLVGSWLVVLLMMGIWGGNKRLVNAVLAAAPVVLLLSLTLPTGKGSWVYYGFVKDLSQTVGSPLWQAGWGLTAFYALAWVGGVRIGEVATMGALVVVSFVEPLSGQFAVGGDWRPWLVIGGVQLFRFWQVPHSARALASAAAFLAALMAEDQSPEWQAHSLVAGSQALLAIAMLLGAGGTDLLSRALRSLSAVWLSVSVLLILAGVGPWEILHDVRFGYGLAAFVLGRWYAHQFWEPWHKPAAAVNLAATVALAVPEFLGSSESLLGKEATLPLVLGAGFFLTAALISAAKGGWLARWWQWWMVLEPEPA